MPAVLPKFSFPVPANKSGQAFGSAEELLAKLGSESSGQYLVGSQGMWHGGIHITEETIPWCALSTNSEAEKAFYNNQPYKGEQFVRCMADGEIVAYRVCKDYDSAAISWNNGQLHMSNSFVLVKHYIQPGETAASGLAFYTLYMNLAPFSAYAQSGGELTRKVVKAQKFYMSAEDVTAKPAKSAGMLSAEILVTLSDNIISRASDNRQFTEVTLVAETTNAANTTLAAGTKIWTVSDRGSLASAATVPKPSWWAKCSPAYGAQSGGQVSAVLRTGVKYYLSSDDVQKGISPGKLTEGFPLSYEPGKTAQQITRAIMKPGTNPPEPSGALNTFSLATLGKDLGKLKKGDRVWVVSDADYLTPSTPDASGTEPTFDGVVKPATAIPISAGDSIGHLGFYELPTDNGKKSRYQVHIECLSMDDVAKFIGNPENVGTDKPAFLRFKPGLKLFDKNEAGQIAASERQTKSDGIVTLAKVPVVKEGDQPKYYQIRQEGGWIAASDAQLISQYSLAERGFAALNKSSASFDLIDGKLQPDNIVKEILQQLEAAAKADTRPNYALNQYNYQRLLAKIDSNNDGTYSIDEYMQALNNVSYRDRLQRIIAKHPSEWYYGKDDPMWKTYLDTLTGEHAKWKTYMETFIEKMTWMKQIPGIEPAPWHMHPIVFLDGLSASDDEMDLKWLIVPTGQLTFDVEGNDIDSSPWFSRKIHWPGGVSGVTIGRGYDLGQQTNAGNDLTNVGIAEPLKSWLVGSSGMSSTAANTRIQSSDNTIRTSNITRKQQYELFIIAYERLENDVKRICQKTDSIRTYHPNPNATPEQAWSDIPDKIKEVLADLRYRGDYTPSARAIIQRLAYSGDIAGFGRELSNKANWINVPQDRFEQRINYYGN